LKETELCNPEREFICKLSNKIGVIFFLTLNRAESISGQFEPLLFFRQILK